MKKTDSRIEATVWCKKTLDFDKWEIANRNESKKLRLSVELSENEIGSIVQKICGQIAFGKKSPLEDLFENLIHSELEDFAFIKFIGKDGVETNNGCCSDFKDWKQLKNIKTESLWFGHDPTPVFEYDRIKDEVLIWIDDKYIGTNKEEYSITFTWHEYKENLKRLENDLNDFLILLKSWLENKSPELAEKITGKIREKLGV